MTTLFLFAKRFTASLTAVFFLFSTVSPSLTAAIRPDENALLRPSAADYLISSSLGKATGGETGEGNGRLVFLIQDLHCHPEVQHNITSILESLSSRYNISRVFLEGASGTVDLSWYDTITEPQLKNSFIETLMAQGKLSGATYFGLKHPEYDNKLFGLENKELHSQNLVRLSRIMDSQAETARILARARQSLERTKKDYFSERHRRLDTVVREYRAGRMTSDKYYALLTNLCRKAGIDINGYINIVAYQRIREQEQHINYRLAGHELQRQMAALREQLPYNEYRALTEKAGRKDSQDELLDAVAAAAERHQLYFDHEVGAGLSPLYRFACKSIQGGQAHTLPGLSNLARLLECRSLERALDPLAMVTEEKRLVRDLRNRFSANKHERAAGFLADYFNCLEDCLNAKLTSDDYAWFTSQYDRFVRQWISYVGDETYAGLEPELRESRAFYDVNIERNKTFLGAITAGGMYAAAANTVPAVPAVKSDAPRPVDVVVMGGFHTEGMSRLLKEQGIPYVMITPHVTRSAAFSDTVYRSLVEEQGKLLASTIKCLEPDQSPPLVKGWAAVSVMVPLLLNSRCRPEEVVRHMSPLLLKGVGPGASLKVDRIEGKNRIVYTLTVDNTAIAFNVDSENSRWELKENKASSKIAEEFPALRDVLRSLRELSAFAMPQSIIPDNYTPAMLAWNPYALARALPGTTAVLETSADVSRVILEAFKKKNMLLGKKEYSKQRTALAQIATGIMRQTVEIDVNRNPDLLQKDAGALAIMEWDEKRGVLIIHVHEAFFKGLEGKSEADVEELLRLLAYHEVFEYLTLNGDKRSPLLADYNIFRNRLPQGAENLNEEFHAFLQGGMAGSLLKDTFPGELLRQGRLFEYARSVVSQPPYCYFPALRVLIRANKSFGAKVNLKYAELRACEMMITDKNNETEKQLAKYLFRTGQGNIDLLRVLGKITDDQHRIVTDIRNKVDDIQKRASGNEKTMDALLNKELKPVIEKYKKPLRELKENLFPVFKWTATIKDERTCGSMARYLMFPETMALFCSYYGIEEISFLRVVREKSDFVPYLEATIHISQPSKSDDKASPGEGEPNELTGVFAQLKKNDRDNGPCMLKKGKLAGFDRYLRETITGLLVKKGISKNNAARYADTLARMNVAFLNRLCILGTIDDRQKETLCSIRSFIEAQEKKKGKSLTPKGQYDFYVNNLEVNVQPFIKKSDLSSCGIEKSIESIDAYYQEIKSSTRQKNVLEECLYPRSFLKPLAGIYDLSLSAMTDLLRDCNSDFYEILPREYPGVKEAASNNGNYEKAWKSAIQRCVRERESKRVSPFPRSHRRRYDDPYDAYTKAGEICADYFRYAVLNIKEVADMQELTAYLQDPGITEAQKLIRLLTGSGAIDVTDWYDDEITIMRISGAHNRSIKIKKNPLLVNEGGWAMVTVDDEKDEFLVNGAFLNALRDPDLCREYAPKMLFEKAHAHFTGLIPLHEDYENQALHSTRSEVYRDFSTYLKEHQHRVRNSVTFHEYIFSLEEKNVGGERLTGIAKELAEQAALIRFAQRAATIEYAKSSGLGERIREPFEAYISDKDDSLLPGLSKAGPDKVALLNMLNDLTPGVPKAVITGDSRGNSEDRLPECVHTDDWWVACEGGGHMYRPGKEGKPFWYYPLADRQTLENEVTAFLGERGVSFTFYAEKKECELTVIPGDINGYDRVRLSKSLADKLEGKFGKMYSVADTSVAIEIFQVDKRKAVELWVDALAENRITAAYPKDSRLKTDMMRRDPMKERLKKGILSGTACLGDSQNDHSMLNYVAENGGTAVYFGTYTEGLRPDVYISPVKGHRGVEAFLREHFRSMNSAGKPARSPKRNRRNVPAKNELIEIEPTIEQQSLEPVSIAAQGIGQGSLEAAIKNGKKISCTKPFRDVAEARIKKIFHDEFGVDIENAGIVILEELPPEIQTPGALLFSPEQKKAVVVIPRSVKEGFIDNREPFLTNKRAEFISTYIIFRFMSLYQPECRIGQYFSGYLSQKEGVSESAVHSFDKKNGASFLRCFEDIVLLPFSRLRRGTIEKRFRDAATQNIVVKDIMELFHAKGQESDAPETVSLPKNKVKKDPIALELETAVQSEFSVAKYKNGGDHTVSDDPLLIEKIRECPKEDQEEIIKNLALYLRLRHQAINTTTSQIGMRFNGYLSPRRELKATFNTDLLDAEIRKGRFNAYCQNLINKETVFGVEKELADCINALRNSSIGEPSALNAQIIISEPAQKEMSSKNDKDKYYKEKELVLEKIPELNDEDDLDIPDALGENLQGLISCAISALEQTGLFWLVKEMQGESDKVAKQLVRLFTLKEAGARDVSDLYLKKVNIIQKAGGYQVEVWDNDLLVNEGGWCMATVSDGGKKLLVNRIILDAFRDPSLRQAYALNMTMEEFLAIISEHEMKEYEALHVSGSNVSFDRFLGEHKNKYRKDVNGFHEYIFALEKKMNDGDASLTREERELSRQAPLIRFSQRVVVSHVLKANGLMERLKKPFGLYVANKHDSLPADSSRTTREQVELLNMLNRLTGGITKAVFTVNSMNKNRKALETMVDTLAEERIKAKYLHDSSLEAKLTAYKERRARLKERIMKGILSGMICIGDSQNDHAMLNYAAENGGTAIFAGTHTEGLDPRVFVLPVKGHLGVEAFLREHVQSMMIEQIRSKSYSERPVDIIVKDIYALGFDGALERAQEEAIVRAHVQIDEALSLTQKGRRVAARIRQYFEFIFSDKDSSLTFDSAAVDGPMGKILNELHRVTGSSFYLMTGADRERVKDLFVRHLDFKPGFSCDGGGTIFGPGEYGHPYSSHPLINDKKELEEIKDMIEVAVSKSGIDIGRIDFYEKPAGLPVELTTKIEHSTYEDRDRIIQILRPMLENRYKGEVRTSNTSVGIEVFKKDKADAIIEILSAHYEESGIPVEKMLADSMVVGDSENDVTMLNLVADAGGIAIFVGRPLPGLMKKLSHNVFVSPVQGPWASAAFLTMHLEQYASHNPSHSDIVLEAARPSGTMLTPSKFLRYLANASAVAGDGKGAFIGVYDEVTEQDFKRLALIPHAAAVCRGNPPGSEFLCLAPVKLDESQPVVPVTIRVRYEGEMGIPVCYADVSYFGEDASRVFTIAARHFVARLEDRIFAGAISDGFPHSVDVLEIRGTAATMIKMKFPPVSSRTVVSVITGEQDAYRIPSSLTRITPEDIYNGSAHPMEIYEPLIASSRRGISRPPARAIMKADARVLQNMEYIKWLEHSAVTTIQLKHIINPEDPIRLNKMTGRREDSLKRQLAHLKKQSIDFIAEIPPVETVSIEKIKDACEHWLDIGFSGIALDLSQKKYIPDSAPVEINDAFLIHPDAYKEVILPQNVEEAIKVKWRETGFIVVERFGPADKMPYCPEHRTCYEFYAENQLSIDCAAEARQYLIDLADASPDAFAFPMGLLHGGYVDESPEGYAASLDKERRYNITDEELSKLFGGDPIPPAVGDDVIENSIKAATQSLGIREILTAA